MQECLTYFGQLTEAQQLQAVSEFERRLTPGNRNLSAFLVTIMGEVESGSSNTSSLAPTRSAAASPPVPATSKGRLNMQRLIADALFLDDLLPVRSSCCFLYQDVKLTYYTVTVLLQHHS